MVQQRYSVNQRLQLRLQVDYETGPHGGIHIQQRVFPQQRKKKRIQARSSIWRSSDGLLPDAPVYQQKPVSPVRFDLILALFICFGYLNARIDETWNMAILLRFSHIRASPGCSGYNPYVFHNPAHLVSGVHKNGVARLWIHFFGVLIRLSNRHGVNQDCFVLLQTF